MELQAQAFGKFPVAIPIHPDVFLGVRKMEAEIVAMGLKLCNAPWDAAGVATSGGTKSILMACLSARQKAYAEKNITEPEISFRILPEIAHPALRKAAQYFGFKMHLVASPASIIPGGCVSRSPSYQQHCSSRRFGTKLPSRYH
ncbi:hypothetical protein BDZ45DRAFT_787844 [Acephala macrosclerotiorum]|nr:hypothetical protein BDZ45DRAFT_787844 [Acephala macrosclerotiorum]